MAMFVHVTTAEKARAIKRAGLKPGRAWRSLFAMPVVPNFMMTHQWTRELQKWSCQRMVGVYFRIPDNETVRVGRFKEPKHLMTAANASALVRTADTLGLEVEVLRPIGAKDIHQSAISAVSLAGATFRARTASNRAVVPFACFGANPAVESCAKHSKTASSRCTNFALRVQTIARDLASQIAYRRGRGENEGDGK